MISAARMKSVAARIGFSACGLAPAAPLSAARQEEWRAWIAEGCHGGMDYLARNLDKRFDPRLLVPGARTVVSLAVNYYPGTLVAPSVADGKEMSASADAGSEAFWRLARYAYGTDYHEVVKSMLRRLLTEVGLVENEDGRCFVDTAPIDEKYWAERCGLGWRGRHTQLILPQAGSYYFLGELVLVREADCYDAPVTPRCGTCHACIDACPTGALCAGGTMDARRCLSYLTIEHRGDLPAGAAACLSPCFYGCDRCAEACPWSRRFARPTAIAALQPRPDLLAMTPADWRVLTPGRYTELFRKSAVKRAKYEGLMRNIRAMD